MKRKLLMFLSLMVLICTSAWAGVKTVTSQSELVTAVSEASSGDVIKLSTSKGCTSYTLYDTSYFMNDDAPTNKSLTFEGETDDNGQLKVTWKYGSSVALQGEHGSDYSLKGAKNVTFKNVIFEDNCTCNNYFRGFTYVDGLTFDNCTFHNMMGYFGYGNASFNNCLFDVASVCEYAVKTYGGKNYYFKECTIKSNNKGYIQIYTQDNTETIHSVEVESCTFIKGTNSSKTPVYYYDQGPTEGAILNITFKGNNVNTDNAIPTNTTTNSWLYGDMKYNTTSSKTKVYFGETLVWANGVKVADPPVAPAATNVATFNGENYTDLNAALVAAATYAKANRNDESKTVQIIANIDLTGKTWTPVELNLGHLIIDGGNHTITGMNNALIEKTGSGGQYLRVSNLTFYKPSVSTDYAAVICGYADAMNELTFTNVTINEATVTGSIYAGAFVAYAAGYNVLNNGPVFSQLTFTNCSVTSSTITSSGSVGALMGHASGNLWTRIAVTGTTVTGNTVTCTGSSSEKAGSLFGTIGAGGICEAQSTAGTYVSATVSGNTVNGAAETTIYGRQGTPTGTLRLTEGGSYDAQPIIASDWAKCADGFELKQGTDGKWTVSEAATDPDFFADAQGVWHIANAQGLVKFANAVNSSATTYKKSVVLDEDIDMAGVAFTAIGDVNSYPSKTFGGTFDGNNKTISNLTVSATGENATAGLFGSTVGVIKNVTLDHATITSEHYAGGICGYSSSNVGEEINNCKVINSIITSKPRLTNDGYDDGDKAGGIIGYTVSGDKVQNCTVENTTITAHRDLGAIAGMLNTNVTFKNNKAKDCTIIQDNTNKYKDFVETIGQLVGRFGSDTNIDNTNTATNVSIVRTIYNLDDLQKFRNNINSKPAAFTNHTVKLMADIDLYNEEWAPIKASNLTFDGQNHTIKHLKVTTEDKNVGFFGEASISTVKDLTIDGASVTGINHVAVIAGDGLCGHFINCHVKNATVTTKVKDDDDGDKAGAICGYLSGEPTAEVTNCSAENVTVTGYRDIAALVGYANKAATVTGNTAKNSTVVCDLKNNANYKNYTTDDAHDANQIVGEKVETAKVENNTVENVTVEYLKLTVNTKDENTASVKTENQTSQASTKVGDTSTEAIQSNITETTTNVSGVQLTIDETPATSTTEAKPAGVQAVVDAAKTSAKNTAQSAEASSTDKEVAQAFTSAIATATEVKIKVDVKVTASDYVAPAETSEATKTGAITFQLEPEATVTVKKSETEEVSQTVPVTNDMIDQDQDIEVKIYTGFNPALILHTDKDGNMIESFTGDRISYNSETGVATVKIHHFSSLTAYEAPSVAMIGDTKYATLSAALIAANSGDVIKILDGTWGADAIGTLDAAGSYTNANAVRYKSLTIQPAEGATVKFTSTVSLGYDDSSTANATMTVKNLNFDGASLMLSNYAQNTVEGCTFTNGTSNTAGVLIVQDACCKNHKTTGEYPASQITIKNCSINGSNDGASGIRLRNSGNVTIEGCTVENSKMNGILFESNTSVDNTAAKTISIKDNTIKEWNSTNTAEQGRGMRLALGTLASGSTVTIEGNYFRKATTGLDTPDFAKITEAGYATVNLSGNYWNNKALSEVSGNSNIYTCNATNTTLTSVINDVVPVAKIGSVEYPTLQAALDAANAGDRVQLLQDVVESVLVRPGKELTLDMNGKKLTESSSNSPSAYNIDNQGILTIIGNGTIEDANDGDNSSLIRNLGTLTIENGTFSSKYGCNAVKNDGDEDNVDGETISHTYLTINGGTFNQNTDNATYSVILNWTEVTINGGTFNGNNLTGSSAISSGGNPSDATLGKLTITGGTFVNFDKAVSLVNNYINCGNATISGGKFDGTITKAANTGSIAISGGYFKTAPAAAYIAKGFKLVDTPDGEEKTAGYVKTVVDARVAQIGETTYATMQEAFDACPTDGTEATTITLLADVEDGASFGFADGTSGRNIVLDLNNKKYTFKDPGMGSTGTKTQAMHLASGNTLVVKNGTLAINSETTTIYRMIQNYCDLTLENVIVDTKNNMPATFSSYNNSFCRGTVTLKGNTQFLASSATAISFDIDGAYCKYNCDVELVIAEGFNGTIEGKVEYVKSTTEGHTATLTDNAGYFKAQVGNYLYTSLAAAVNAATTGQTVTLLANITESAQAVVDKAVTIDFAGKTLTSTMSQSGKSDDERFAVKTTAAVTMKNGTIAATDSRAIVSRANLTLTDMTVSTSGDHSDGVNVGSYAGNLTITNGTYTGEYAVGSFASDHAVTINGATLNGELYHNGSYKNLALTVDNATINDNAGCGVYISGQNIYTDLGQTAHVANHQVAISNSTITGTTGIEVKFADVTLTNCNVTATGEPTYDKNNNGSTSKGFAIVSTDNSMNAENASLIGKIVIKGENGKYKGAIGLKTVTEAVDPEAEYAISGGKFSVEPAKAYLVENFYASAITGDYAYEVKLKEVVVPEEKTTVTTEGNTTTTTTTNVASTTVTTTDGTNSSTTVTSNIDLTVTTGEGTSESTVVDVNKGDEVKATETTTQAQVDAAAAAAAAVVQTMATEAVSNFTETKAETNVATTEKTATESTVITGTETVSGKTLLEIVQTAAVAEVASVTEENKAEVIKAADVKKNIYIELTAASVKQEAATAQTAAKTTVTTMTFDVKPKATVVVDGTPVTTVIPNSLITEAITFRLPVDAKVTETMVEVFHKADGATSSTSIGYHPIKSTTKTVGEETVTEKYIELSAKAFSEYSYQLSDKTFSMTYYAGNDEKVETTDPEAFAAIQAGTPNAIGIVSEDFADWAEAQTNVVVKKQVYGVDFYVCPKFVLTDNKNFYSPVNFVAKTGSYSRTLTTKFSSTVLPFAFSTDNITGGDLDDVKIWVFSHYKTDNGNDVAYFQENTSIEAGNPCYIKSGATSEITRLLKVEFANTPITAKVDNSNAMKGTYQQDGAYNAENYYAINTAGTALAPTKNSSEWKLGAFRSCFYAGGMNLTNSSNSKRILIGVADSNVTAIDAATVQKAEGKVFSVNGQYLGTDMQNLPKGIYIINGKKVWKK